MMKVSVIVPVYNAELYLQRCIESLCNQTLFHTEYEVIAINDGSTDESLRILYEMQQVYPHLVVYTQENKGASSARNFGLRTARGEYVGFADADDYVEPNMYETMYKEAICHRADIVFCNLYENDKKKPAYLQSGIYAKKEIEKKIYPRLISSCDEKKIGSTLRGHVAIKLFKRSLIVENDIGFCEELVYNEDGLFCILATLQAATYVYMGEEYLYHQVLNRESLTKRYINDLWLKQKKMLSLLENCVQGIDFPFDEQIAKKALKIAIYSIENEIKGKNKNSAKLRIENVKKILSDRELLRYTKRLTYKKQKKIECAYLFAIRIRSAILALLCAKWRHRNNKYI